MLEASDWTSNRTWVFRSADYYAGNWPLILAVVAILLALAVVQGTYVDPHLPGAVYRGAFWIAVIASALLVAAWLLVRLGDWLYRGVVESFRSIKRNELQELVPFFDRVVGGDRPSLNDLKQIFNANNDVFKVLEKVVKYSRKRRSELVGFCTIVPMKSEAEPLLATEQLNGLRMSAEHIAAPRKQVRVLYIGSIGAQGAKPRAAVLNYVLGVMDDAAKHGVRRVYTRPVTKDGLRVATKYGFEPVMGDVRPGELRRLYFLDVGGPESHKRVKKRVSKPLPIGQ